MRKVREFDPARHLDNPEVIAAYVKEVTQRIAELESVCGQLYQVIGSLAFHAGCFDHPDVQRALDNASRARLQHRNLLPWPRTALKTVARATKKAPGSRRT